jgi:lysophospholipase L1-like esterase
MKSIICSFLVLACSATASRADQKPLLDSPRYVAMGSSYAAGAGIGAIVPQTPKRCGRTVNNYPHLLAERLRLTLNDVSCGGATTANILSAWGELPPQIDAVTLDTRLVTITIGGNDVNFVRDLALGVCAKIGSDQGMKRSCPVNPATSENDWISLEQRLREIARAVFVRAPNAHLIFVDYLKVIPDNKVCATIPLDAEATGKARAKFRRLANLTAKVAREEGALVLRASRLSKGHETCSADPWAIGYPAPGAPWHPTAAGHTAVANALVRLIRKQRL